MKKDWTYKKLGEVAEVIGGSTPKTSEPANWVGSNMWVTPAELDGSKYFGKTQRTISDEAASKLQLLPIGTVLFSSRAPIGKVAITTVPMYCNQGFKNIVCGDSLYNEYVYWCLKYNVPLLQSLGVGATFKELSKSAMSDFSIPIPPLSIQHSIVRELDLLHSMIEKKKEQLYELDNLAQSLFYQMFGDPITNPMGWEIKKMGEVGIFERGKGISKSDFVDDGVPCVHYGQLHTAFGAYTTKHLACIPESLIDNPRIAHPGDVLLALTSEDVEGSCKSTAWYGDYDVIVGSDAAVYHHNQDGMYISFYTRTEAFYKQKEKYAHGFKVTHISTKDIETFTIPLPPLSLQQSFAAKIEAIEAQKALVRQSIEEAHTLLAARMQYYFE